MASYTLSPIGGAGSQFFDNSGNVLTGGKLYTYAAGTTTPQTTWTTPAGNVQNSNPIILNAAGRPANEIWLSVAYSYKFVIKDSNDVLIATYDNIPGLPQPAIVNDASSVSYEPNILVTAGSFVIGQTYMIASLGDTDFVSIGAAYNSTGQVFIATGIGSGTGTAYVSTTVQTRLRTYEASGGSNYIGFLQAGAGAITTETVQDKLRQIVSLEDFGASATSTPTENATAFIAAIQAGGRISTPQQAYTFQFDGTPITYTGTILDINLGPFKHTFLNFGGFVCNNVRSLQYNGRFTANNGYCKGLGRFRNLQVVNIETIEITDVYCDNPTDDAQFFGLEYASNNYDDNQLTINVGNAIFKNVITETQPFPSAMPMTGFGNFGSSSTQTQQHLVHFDNLYVENFYSVSSDGVTVIDGDSDFFRLFTNPTRLTIGNCVVKNIAKRFIKTQEQAEVVVNNLKASTDSRFINTNLIGFFEGQATAQTAAPTRFTILHGVVDFANKVNFFNASGADHEMFVQNLKYKNIIVYSSTQNILFDAKNITGEGFRLLAVNSNRVNIKNIVDSNLEAVVCSKPIIDGFNIAPVLTTSGFPIANAILRNGDFVNVDVNSRVAYVSEITNVSLTYTTGTTPRRPFQPVSSGIIKVNGLTVNSIVSGTQTFETPGVGTSGTMIIRDYRSTNQTLAFFSSGSWDFVLDDCDDDTVVGAGVASVVRATYA